MDDVVQFLTINGTLGLKNPFISNYDGKPALSLEKVTYIPMCDISGAAQISTTLPVELNFAIPQTQNINDTSMTTSSSIIAQKSEATIKFSSPNGLSPTGGMITLEADLSQLEYNPFMSSSCTSGEIEYNDTITQFYDATSTLTGAGINIFYKALQFEDYKMG